MTDPDPLADYPVMREYLRDRHAAPPPNGTAPQPARPPAEPARPHPVARRLADVRAEPVRWLLPGWVPRGAVTVLDGDPGTGKSTITASWAASVSRGWPWPTGAREPAGPAGVLLLSAEDDAARTIRPRLDAAGADVQRVHILDAVRVGDHERPPVLPDDLELIEGLVRDRGVSLVVIDPLMAYLSGDVDSHRDQDIRRCLHRLRLLAERTGAAVVVIRHLNKLAAGPALYRGGGSIGIVGAARAALVVGRDPDRPDRRVLAATKANLGPLPRSLTYSLEPVGSVARIAWGEPCDLTADDIVAQPGPRRRSAGDRAADALAELLAAGPRPAAELEAELRRQGYGERAIARARRQLGVRAEREGFGRGGAWVWVLPDPDAEAEGDL